MSRCTTTSMYVGGRKVDLRTHAVWARTADGYEQVRSWKALPAEPTDVVVTAVDAGPPDPAGGDLPGTYTARVSRDTARGAAGRAEMRRRGVDVDVAMQGMSFAQLDTRPGADNGAALDGDGRDVIGLEVTDTGLVGRLAVNIDPQHGFGTAGAAASAIEGALDVPVPADGAHLVTVRPDLDSVGAMAVLVMRRWGYDPRSDPAAMARIAAISVSDNPARRPWPGPRHRTDVVVVGDLEPLASLIGDFRVPMPDRVAAAVTWLQTGTFPGQQDRAEQVRAEKAQARAASTVTPVSADVTYVESGHRGGVALGYDHTPVVVAFNPAMPNRDLPPYAKFTVARWNGDVPLDMGAVRDELNALESAAGGEGAWGGTSTIIGSPQGTSSRLAPDVVAAVVAKHAAAAKAADQLHDT